MGHRGRPTRFLASVAAWGVVVGLVGVVAFLVVVGEPRPASSVGPLPWFAVGAAVGTVIGWSAPWRFVFRLRRGDDAVVDLRGATGERAGERARTQAGRAAPGTRRPARR